MKKNLRIFGLLCSGILLCSSALAQTGSLSGTVTDAQTGEVLPGVNILLQELQQGTASGVDGSYTIENVPEGNYTLIATFIGYRRFRAQVEIAGNEVTQNIELESDVLGLEEVVVTALGFEANADELGTSSSRVAGDQISASGEVDVISGLSAKAAGVNITSSSGDPGAASRIVIRGANTITGSNEPLFVVDGVPVFNSTFRNGTGGVVQQSRINDLNPDDIESVQVLKGPSAAALWGSRAANGVILIETKTGRPSQDGKISISVKSQLSYDELNKTVDLQRQFGQGEGGVFNATTPFSWGDKVENRPGGEDVVDMSNGNAYFGPDGEKYGLITQKNSRQTYDHSQRIFEDGFKAENSLALSGGDDNGVFYLSVGNLTQDGIILDNSNFDRTSLKGTATRYFNNLTASVNVQYANTSSNRIQQGSNTSGLLLGAFRTPPDFDMHPIMVDYVSENGSLIPNGHRSYRNPLGEPGSPGYNNPLWTIENVRNSSKVRRILGSTELSYDPVNWLNITHRLGVDTYTDRRYVVRPANDSSNPTGSLREESISEYQVNSDLIAKASHAINQNFSGSILIGWNLNHRETDQIGATSTDIILESFNRDISNYNSKNPFQERTLIRTSALYSVLNLNAYDMFFLELTGRQESASTFGPDTDATFFYPSASLAWQFTEMNMFSDGVLNFGKLRVSYGEAGIQPPAYETTTPFIQDDFTSSWGDGLHPAEYGGGFGRSGGAGNPLLRVERTKEFEFGTDLRFFNDRLILNLTRYITETDDAILGVDRAPSSGFINQTANAATLENKGFEAEMNVEVIRARSFSWVVRGNWSKNVNTVTSLAGANQIFLEGFTSMASSAILGEQYGIFFGNQWRRASEEPITNSEAANGFTVGNNDLVLNDRGFPMTADAQGIIGDPNPDWRAGIGSTFRFKNLTFDFLIDIKYGGDVWNGTKGALYYFGVHGDQVWETTTDQPLTSFDGETIPAGTTFRGYIEDFGAGPVAVTESAFYSGPMSGFTGPAEPFIEDGGFVRLRQVSIGYSFSGENFRNVTGLHSVDVSVSGRNLFLITDYTGIDPETNLTGPSNGFGLDYFNNPRTRSYMFSLQLNY